MKGEKEELLEKIRSEVVDITDGPFHVEWASDDGGNHTQILLECHEDSSDIMLMIDKKFYKKHQRILVMLVPPGYLEGYEDRDRKLRK